VTNEWTKPEHAEAYLARMKDIPHRAEGEATLLSEIPRQSKRVLDLGCGNGHLLSLVLTHCPGATDMSGNELAFISQKLLSWGPIKIRNFNTALGKCLVSRRKVNTFDHRTAMQLRGTKVLERELLSGMEGIFGTQENFEKYQITRLLQQRADELRRSKRVILLGYGNFRQPHQKVHALLQKLGIPHDYRDGPEPKHDWHSGWVEEAVSLLLQHSPTVGP